MIILTLPAGSYNVVEVPSINRSINQFQSFVHCIYGGYWHAETMDRLMPKIATLAVHFESSRVFHMAKNAMTRFELSFFLQIVFSIVQLLGVGL